MTSTIAADFLAAATAKHAARQARAEALRTNDDLTLEGNVAIGRATADLRDAERAFLAPLDAWKRLPQAERDAQIAEWARDERIPTRVQRTLRNA